MKVFGRNLFWYTVVFGTIATVSRKVVADELQVIDPEGAMTLVVQHTHYMPKRWRGKESSEVVRKEFETLFQVVIPFHQFFSQMIRSHFWQKIILIVLDHTPLTKKNLNCFEVGYY
jgi:hypothetical protein